MELSHGRAQGLHPKVIVEDPIGRHAEEKVNFVPNVPFYVRSEILHVREVKVVPAISSDAEYLECPQRPRLQVGPPADGIDQDVKDNPVTGQEVLTGRSHEQLQVPICNPAKHTRTEGDAP